MDPVPSKKTLLRHGSVSSAHSSVILVYGLKFLEFQKIRKSLSLWAHCQTPGHLIVGAANLSSEGRQPALPHHGLRCHPCQANGDGSCCCNLVIHHCQACSWLPEIGQHQVFFLVVNVTLYCLWGIIQRTCYMKDHNLESRFSFCDKLSGYPKFCLAVWKMSYLSHL